MNVPTTPALARYFSKIRLTLNTTSHFDSAGRQHLSWTLTHLTTGKPYWLGETKIFVTTRDLWAAWKAHQLSLHLQHAQALRLVRYYLRHELDHHQPFNAWLDYRAVARHAAFDEVDTQCWPWSSATASLDRRDRLSTPGWPWSDAPTPAVISRCMRRSDGNGWAKRALKVADFDRQSATRYTAAIRALVETERRRMFDRKMRKTGLRHRHPTRRI
ncbi:hypothetical protein J2X57_002790 [Luteibacter sp. 1214]|uniref:hypothetical protein n=1 Tax=Luteibacter sp. 1214 TaxID=2817735 RepID=UPI00285B43D0|nr:hypothetical protein [Luteibacter sp. 1214]MDR6643569.1 hypothetical protein [Luteibacter sp. 1214]